MARRPEGEGPRADTPAGGAASQAPSGSGPSQSGAAPGSAVGLAWQLSSQSEAPQRLQVRRSLQRAATVAGGSCPAVVAGLTRPSVGALLAPSAPAAHPPALLSALGSHVQVVELCHADLATPTMRAVLGVQGRGGAAAVARRAAAAV
jgi:hypothetical protein